MSRDDNPHLSPQAKSVPQPPDSPALPLAPERAPFWAHPIGFWFIFWGELAERSSFYGMKGILGNYISQQLGFGDSAASVIVHMFQAAVYFLPLLGGWIAENFIGRYRAIVFFCVPYILGHVILGFETVPCLIVALALLAMGSGVTKPNITPLMGMTYDQLRPGQTQLRSDAFALFYVAINIGSAISEIMVPWVLGNWDYQIAFLCPAVLMAFAFVFFAAGKPFYAKETIVRRRLTAEQRAERRVVLRRLLGVFCMVLFYWMIFDQHSTTWNFFVRDYVNWEEFGFKRPEQLQAINPVLILVFVPALAVIWRVLGQWGIRFRATDKMIVGFVLSVATMALFAIAGFLGSEEQKVSVWWIAGAYVCLTAAEACISVVGLELAFTAAPDSMKSFITAVWLVMVFLGNVVAMSVSWLYGEFMAPGWYFSMQMLMMVAVAIAFVPLARRFNAAVDTAAAHGV